MAEPETLGGRLTAELTSLALCWRVVRSDGVALGFTTHDRPLDIAGLRYESAPGMAPSAVVSSDGLDVDTMDVAGALSADAITGTPDAAILSATIQPSLAPTRTIFSRGKSLRSASTCRMSLARSTWTSRYCRPCSTGTSAAASKRVSMTSSLRRAADP